MAITLHEAQILLRWFSEITDRKHEILFDTI
jgi:hypothetical protein